jgi:hypothetical protein
VFIWSLSLPDCSIMRTIWLLCMATRAFDKGFWTHRVIAAKKWTCELEARNLVAAN